MNDSENEEPVLSREELDALLERLSDRGPGGAWAGASRKDSASEAKIVSLSLQRSSIEFAEQITRSMSNLFQTSIQITLIDWRSSEPEEFQQLMVANDKAIAFDLVPGAGHGLLLVGKTLFFQLLCLNFGADPNIKSSTPPSRPYTTIECRFYRRFVADLLAKLGECWSEDKRLEPKITDLISREHVKDEGADELYLATFDVSGFSEVCRLRVAVPKAAFDDRIAAAREVSSLSGAHVEDAVLEMGLDLRVGIGSVEMSLAALSSMSEGDVIPIESVDGGELLVTLGGVPKFFAIRGAVGRRLAVQLTDRI